MTVRALPYQRFKDPEVQRAFDALSQAIQEGNGERGDPKNRWLTVNDAFNGVLTTLILGGGDGSGSPSGAGGILPPGAPGGPGGGGVFNPVGPVIDSLIDSVRNDPFFIFLGEQIKLISMPELPGSVAKQIEAAQNQVDDLMVAQQVLVDAALSQQGSSITSLQTITDTQATQITTLQTGVSGNSSAIVTLQTTTDSQATQITTLASRTTAAESSVSNLMSTTPTSAAWWTGLKTQADNATSNVSMLMSTTPTSALWWSGLKSQADAATSSVTMLMSATPTSASWWSGLSTDVANSKSSIANLMSTTPTSAQWWSGLKTQVDNASAQIVNLQSTTPTSASWWAQLNSTVNGNSASIQTLQNTTNGLSAQYSVKLDVNGAVSGFGLASSSGLGSRFYVRADRFAVGSPGVADINSDANVPFIVQTGPGSWGGPGVYIKDASIASASIDSAKIISLDAGKVTFGQMSGERINVNTLYADRIVSNSIARTRYYSQTGTRPANGQTQDLALSWDYTFQASPGTPVILKLEVGMATAVTQYQVYWDMWSYNGWSLFWDVYYKNGQELGSRYLYSATSRAVTVPAGQVAWFNVRASANNNGGYFGLVDMFITEQRA